MSEGRASYPGGYPHVTETSSFADGDVYAFATDHEGPISVTASPVATRVMTLQYAVSGCMHYDFGDHDYTFEPGVLLILWPHCPRTLHLAAGEHWHSLAVRGDLSALPPVFALPERQRGYAVFEIPDELGAAYRALHQRLCSEWLAPDDSYSRSLRVAMCADWCFRWRRWYDSRRPAGDARVHAALQAIHRHPARHYSLDELARIAGCGRTSLATRFAAEVGQPPARYAESLRMAQAARLLELSDLRIVEVAAQLGYDDHRHFGRRFQAHHGQTPSAWRQRRR